MIPPKWQMVSLDAIARAGRDVRAIQQKPKPTKPTKPTTPGTLNPPGPVPPMPPAVPTPHGFAVTDAQPPRPSRAGGQEPSERRSDLSKAA